MKIARLNEKTVLLSEVEKPFLWVKPLHTKFPSAIEIVPSFEEILITFAEKIVNLKWVQEKTETIEITDSVDETVAELFIPICFDRQFAIDVERVEKITGKPFDSIVDLISKTEFRVEFLGFLPGFPYLTGLMEEFKIPRLESPRNQVLAGSFAVAENQTGIYPLDSPGGWNILGNCPVNLFDVKSDNTTLFLPSDRVHVEPVSLKDHGVIKAQSLTREMLLK